ncbi:hypothetical protein MKK88_01045 [Methylobacterium sp. E-005]|uniref:hypothetical protein n=1 Tax=Methylobacterium sp. E-005 TaxID=2836549 RepID=UPI001FBB29EC|nr:hypothetical protein [Methylobacterium sp. E-005]MCJ2084582.1 hypothetical protein [Methylobacterium sp. E-005]
MPRFYIFSDQASAQACVDGVDARARQIYAERKFTEDPATGGFVSKDVNGNDIPGAVTTSFAVPWQRADGNWVVAHCETVPYAAVNLDATQTPSLTVTAFVAQDIPAGTPVETFDLTWLPPSPVLPDAAL